MVPYLFIQHIFIGSELLISSKWVVLILSFSLWPWAPIIEWLGLERTSGDHQVQSPAGAGSCRTGCTRFYPGIFLISPEKDTPQILLAAWQCSVTLRVRKLFLIFRCNFLCFSLCLLCLVLSLGTAGENLAPFS